MINLIVTAIRQSKGQFFTVKFIKKDGTLRKMNCRTGVTKYLKNPCHELQYEHLQSLDKEFITVYDVQKKGYRSFYPDSVKELNIRKFRFSTEEI